MAMMKYHDRNACYYRALRDILRALLCEERLPRATVRIRYGGIILSFEGDWTMQLPDNMQVHADLSYVDAKGNPAAVDGAPVWSTDRPDLVTLTVAPDGLSADIAAVGPLGAAQIVVDADADLGEGTVPLKTIGSIEVIGSEAVSGTINFGAPTQQGGGDGGGGGPV